MKLAEISKKYSHEQKMFFIFIIVNLIVWSLVGTIRTVLPTDSLDLFIQFSKAICLYMR